MKHRWTYIGPGLGYACGDCGKDVASKGKMTQKVANESCPAGNSPEYGELQAAMSALSWRIDDLALKVANIEAGPSKAP